MCPWTESNPPTRDLVELNLIMQLKLKVQFAPINERSSWAQPVKFAVQASGKGARERRAIFAAIPAGRFSRHRICLPNHSLNHFAP